MVCGVSLVAAHRLGIWDLGFLTRDQIQALVVKAPNHRTAREFLILSYFFMSFNLLLLLETGILDNMQILYIIIANMATVHTVHLPLPRYAIVF